MSYPVQDAALGRRVRVTTAEGEQTMGVVIRRDTSPEQRRLVIQLDDGRVLVGQEIETWVPMSEDQSPYDDEIRFVVTVRTTSVEPMARVGAYVRHALRAIDLPLAEGNVRVTSVEYLEFPPAPRLRWSPLWWVQDPDGQVMLWRGRSGEQHEGWTLLWLWPVEELLMAHQRLLMKGALTLDEMGLRWDDRPRFADWKVSVNAINEVAHWAWDDEQSGNVYRAPVIPGPNALPVIPVEVVTHEAIAIQEALDG